MIDQTPLRREVASVVSKAEHRADISTSGKTRTDLFYSYGLSWEGCCCGDGRPPVILGDVWSSAAAALQHITYQAREDAREYSGRCEVVHWF